MPPKNMPPKRINLTLEQRGQLLLDKDSGMTIDEIQKKFGVGKTAVYMILKDRAKILDDLSNGIDPKKKRVKVGDTQLNEAMVAWVAIQRTLDLPVNGNIVRDKAKQFAETLGHKDFKASGGWLHRFKTRYSISFKHNNKVSPNVSGASNINTSNLNVSMDGSYLDGSNATTSQSYFNYTTMDDSMLDASSMTDESTLKDDNDRMHSSILEEVLKHVRAQEGKQREGPGNINIVKSVHDNKMDVLVDLEEENEVTNNQDLVEVDKGNEVDHHDEGTLYKKHDETDKFDHFNIEIDVVREESDIQGEVNDVREDGELPGPSITSNGQEEPAELFEDSSKASGNPLADLLRVPVEHSNPFQKLQAPKVPLTPSITFKEASAAFDVVMKFMKQNGKTEMVDKMKEIQMELEKVRPQSTDMSTISDFFRKNGLEFS